MPLFGPSGGGLTSVGLTTAGVLHSVSGSPLTGSGGTIALGLLTQTANTVLAGPSTGADATPTMRALVAADIPGLDAAKITAGTLADARLSANVPLLNAANTFVAAGGTTMTVVPSGAAQKGLIVKGAPGQSVSLQDWQDSGGTTQASVRFDGALAGLYFFAQGYTNGAYLQPSTGGALVVNTNNGAAAVLVARGFGSQTADLLECQDGAAHVQFGVANRGSGASPIWALRVRAVANAESAAQAHTLGAYAGKAIEVIDDAGASLGFLPIYA